MLSQMLHDVGMDQVHVTLVFDGMILHFFSDVC